MEDFKIEFDLDSKDPEVRDILLNLLEEERSRLATNLLLFGSITAKRSKDPRRIPVAYANEFVAGQLNNLAREEIRFVDLDFSTDTYSSYHDLDSPSITSVYHYSVSKRLWHNHLRVKVGGHVDAETNFHSQPNVHNVIGDLIVEYALDKNGYLLLKVFNNTRYEGILIGEITKTGISIKLNREVNNLQQLFNSKDE